MRASAVVFGSCVVRRFRFSYRAMQHFAPADLDLEPVNPQPGQPSRDVLLTMHLLQILQRRGNVEESDSSPSSQGDDFRATLAQYVEQTTAMLGHLRSRVEQLEKELSSLRGCRKKALGLEQALLKRDFPSD